jgi:hypothetical protein
VIDGIRVGSAEFNRFGRKIRGRVTCHGKRSGLGEAAVKKKGNSLDTVILAAD